MKKITLLLTSLVGLILSASSFSMSSTDKEASIQKSQISILRAVDRAKYLNHYQKDIDKPTLSAYLSDQRGYFKTNDFEFNELAKYDTIFVSIIELNREEKKVGKIRGLSGLADKVHQENLSPSRPLLGGLKALSELSGNKVGIIIPKSMISDDKLLGSISSFLKQYKFINHISIDFGQETFSDSTKYQRFIYELRGLSNDINLTISIASGIPKDQDEADVIKELLNDEVDKWYFSSLKADKKLKHHANIFSPQDNHWSTIQALDYLVGSGIDAKSLELEYSNMSYPTEGHSLTNRERKIPNFTDSIELNQEMAKEHEIITNLEHNLDFIFDIKNKRDFSTESPRMIAVKANFSNDKGLGGLFTRDVFEDSGLNHNAAREGLGYKVAHQMVAMDDVIKGLVKTMEAPHKQPQPINDSIINITKYNNRVSSTNYTTKDSDSCSVDPISDFLKHLITNYPLPLTYSDTIALKRALDKIKGIHDVRESLSPDTQFMREMMLFDQANFTPEHCRKINEFRALAKEKGKDYITSIKQFSDSEAHSISPGEYTEQELIQNDWRGLELKCVHPTIQNAVADAIQELKQHDMKDALLQQHISQYIGRKTSDIMAIEHKHVKLDDEKKNLLKKEINSFKEAHLDSPQSTILQMVHANANKRLISDENRPMENFEVDQTTDIFDFYIDKMMLESWKSPGILTPNEVQAVAEKIKSDYFDFMSNIITLK